MLAAHLRYLSLLVMLAAWATRTRGATLANVNWLSADLVNQMFKHGACSEANVDAGCGVAVAPTKYTSSKGAVQAVIDGSVDFYLDCWESCSGPGLEAAPTGQVGVHGLYAPKWFLQSRPDLKDLGAWRNATHLQRGSEHLAVLGQDEVLVFGTVVSWATAANLTNFFVAENFDALNASMRLFGTETENDQAILDALAARRPVLFLYWEPSMLAYEELYQVERLTVPPAFAQAFPTDVVMKVRRSGHPAPDFLGNFNTFSVNNAMMASALRDFATYASPALPESNANYGLAAASAARTHECARAGRFCGAVGQRWPRLPDPSLPDKLLITVKHCKGFVNVAAAVMNANGECDATGPASLRPTGLVPGSEITGYTIEHLRRTLRNLGYLDSKLIFRCVSSTPILLDHVAMGITHIGASCITITEDRLARVDFSLPMYHTGLGMLVKTDQSFTSGWIFTKPFSPWLWALLLSTAAGVFLLLYLMEEVPRIFELWKTRRQRGVMQPEKNPSRTSVVLRRSVTEGDIASGSCSETGQRLSGRIERTPDGELTINGRIIDDGSVQKVRDWRLDVVLGSMGKKAMQVGTMFAARDGEVSNMRTGGGRSIANLTVCFGVILGAAYIGALSSFLAAKQIAVITSPRDLEGKTVFVSNENCTGKRHAIERYVDDVANAPPHSLRLTRMCLPYQNIIPQLMDEKASACIHDEPVAQAMATEYNDQQGKCELDVVRWTYFGMGYAFPKGSVLREPVSEAVLEVNNRGIRMELESRYFPRSEHCASQEAAGALRLNNMLGLVVIYICLVVIIACFGGLKQFACPQLCEYSGRGRAEAQDQDAAAGTSTVQSFKSGSSQGSRQKAVVPEHPEAAQSSVEFDL